MRWLVVILAAGAAALACDSATGPTTPADPAIWTDRLAYVAEADETGWRAEIPYTFFNRTGETLQIAPCNRAIALRLDRWWHGDWVPAWFPLLPLCPAIPEEIAADATFPDTLHFYADYAWATPRPGLEVRGIDGTYRIVWLGVSYAEVDRDVISLEYRASNPFTLRD